jgi:hypothetical protein
MKLGNTNISKAYLGITEIKKVMLGTTEVWTSFLPFGEAEYTTPGTYSWTAPAGVTSVSVVAVGGGGGGFSGGGSGGAGGGGGGLGWKNNIPVVPGQTYTVVVGNGGARVTQSSGPPGENSYFINLSTVVGFGGTTAFGRLDAGVGGTFVGDGGGNGGNGGTSTTASAGGGGGAGGYSGNGGNGGSTTGAGGDGSGGGGGGGSGAGSSDAAGAGGGVGLLGQGANGSGGGASSDNGNPGTGGSGGANGSVSPGTSTRPSTGGLYGGGGGGAESTSEHGPGGSGAVRIIWGTGISYPTNAVAPVAPSFSPLVTGTNFGDTATSTFSYRSGTTTNHTVYVWAVSENDNSISLPSGWTSLFSATAQNGGPVSGRLLMKKLYENESSTSLTLSGGGNVGLFALNGVITENSITEFGVTTATTLYTNTISTSSNEYFVVMINGDGTDTTPIISQSNLDGFFDLNSQAAGRSIGVGYIGPNTNRTISITRNNTESGFYGITFRVTV